MAKRKPTITLTAMEKELGYGSGALGLTAEDFCRFYSDLRPVGKCAYDQIKKDYEEFQKTSESEYDIKIGDQGPSVTQITSQGQQTVTVTERSSIGFHRFAIDIRYGFGLHVPLLLSRNEVASIMSVAQLRPQVACATIPKLFQLPQELREIIWTFTLTAGKWHIEDITTFEKVTFMGGIGDSSGFYFPLSRNFGALSVNRQMREEVLPLAYQVTTFHLDDMDDLLKLLIAVGERGRANIQSLHFPWESRSDLECRWEKNPASDDHHLQLPALHAMECVQLLKQCTKLKSLHIYFETNLIEEVDPVTFKSNPGIEALHSVKVDNVEIWSFSHEPLEQETLARWLKEGMERHGRI